MPCMAVVGQVGRGRGRKGGRKERERRFIMIIISINYRGCKIPHLLLASWRRRKASQRSFHLQLEVVAAETHNWSNYGVKVSLISRCGWVVYIRKLRKSGLKDFKSGLMGRRAVKCRVLHMTWLLTQQLTGVWLPAQHHAIPNSSMNRQEVPGPALGRGVISSG